ncbi:MAG TPA: PIN domain-containing protein, partial [Planctomycetaceae bacterium]|nr:PIN domain-containing protein [Planctomycetaceae bacterium]
MLVLVDTGVLLRLFERQDPNYSAVQGALKLLWTRGDEPVIAPQNAVEFWNVSTRPTAARGGFGQSVLKTRTRLAAIERICRVLPESPATYLEWKRIVAAYSVTGVSVHDARIAAQMVVWRVGTILTLNSADFRR